MPKQQSKTSRARSSKRAAAATHRISARSDFSDKHARAASRIVSDIQHMIDLSGAGEDKPPATPSTWGMRLMGEDSANRKRYPITTGFLDYFPDAVQAAAEVSFVGNEKHNPGEALHHSRGKSNDHADCIARHLMERGSFVDEVIGDKTYRIRHSAAMLWRAAALLQEELEAEGLCSLPRAAKLP
jgi:hypothetical protein